MATHSLLFVPPPPQPFLPRRFTPISISISSSSSSPPPPPPRLRPSLKPLTPQQLAPLLPWTGSSQQFFQEIGGPMTWAVRLSVSLASAVLLFRDSLVAASVAALFWAWGPMWSVAICNTRLRLRYPYAGVWSARVLAAQPVVPSLLSASDTPLQEFFSTFSESPLIVRIVIGDGSPAVLEMEVPVFDKNLIVETGEPVEVLVLSDRSDLSRFKALHEVYCPRLGIWICEYSRLEKRIFETLSAAMAEERTTAVSALSSRLEDWSPDMGDLVFDKRLKRNKRQLLPAVNLNSFTLASRQPRTQMISEDFNRDRRHGREKDLEHNETGDLN